MNQDLEQWEQTDMSITVEELDAQAEKYADARAEHEAAKKISSDLFAKRQEEEAKLIRMLRATNKLSYKVSGVGSFVVVETLKVRVPTDPEDKAKFYAFIKSQYGIDGVLTYSSPNYAALNTLYNQMIEEHGAAFQLPGVGQPEENITLKFSRRGA